MGFVLFCSDRIQLSFQDGNGLIDRRELGLMMRFMGETLTEEEIQVSRDRVRQHKLIHELRQIMLSVMM